MRLQRRQVAANFGGLETDGKADYRFHLSTPPTTPLTPPHTTTPQMQKTPQMQTKPPTSPASAFASPTRADPRGEGEALRRLHQRREWTAACRLTMTMQTMTLRTLTTTMHRTTLMTLT